MKELHLFAGAGGGILGGLALGHACIGAVEIAPYCQDVLRQRQIDGVPRRVDRIKALGNAQVPRVAAFAFTHLIGVFENYDKK